jgi:hypothetical protein
MERIAIEATASSSDFQFCRVRFQKSGSARYCVQDRLRRGDFTATGLPTWDTWQVNRDGQGTADHRFARSAGPRRAGREAQAVTRRP